jgi:hypothetical protein
MVLPCGCKLCLVNGYGKFVVHLLLIIAGTYLEHGCKLCLVMAINIFLGQIRRLRFMQLVHKYVYVKSSMGDPCTS